VIDQDELSLISQDEYSVLEAATDLNDTTDAEIIEPFEVKFKKQ
jgi:hypothetical protein